MTSKTIDVIYERGVLKPRIKLPLRERAHLKLTLMIPSNPVRRTRGIIKVSPRTARALIHGDESDFWSS